jgi:hypothetical protein
MTLRETAFHWLKGETAKAYAGLVGASPPPGSVRRLNPTGYPESQGAFAERVRRKAAARLRLPCRLELGMQTEFPEPAVHQHRSCQSGEITMERQGRMGPGRRVLRGKCLSTLCALL